MVEVNLGIEERCRITSRYTNTVRNGYNYFLNNDHILVQNIFNVLWIYIASCAIWLWYMVSYIKGGMQAKGIPKQDPEANIWAQEGWEWGVEKAPQWGTS